MSTRPLVASSIDNSAHDSARENTVAGGRALRPGPGEETATARLLAANPGAPLRRGMTFPGAIETLLDPVLIMVWLMAMAMYLGEPLDARLLVASLLAFTLAFPGHVNLTDPVPAAARKSVVTAATVLAALSLFDYASAWLAAVPRYTLFAWYVALPGVLVAGNLAARVALRRAMGRSGAQEIVVVCGVNDIGMGLVQRLRANPYFGVRVLGFFDDRARDRLSPIEENQYLGGFAQLSDFVRANGVDRIYLALPMATQPRIVKILEDLKDTTASIYFAPDIFVTDLINGRISSVEGMPVVTVRESPFFGVNSLVKRTEDIILSAIALLLFSPVFLVVGLAVRIDSPGPAFFRQRRYGLDGREIAVYKFRTMTVVEDGAAAFTAARRNDQRITRVGHVLRRYSLDELPQLFNVLQGRMSMVGPRPHPVAMNEQFRKLIPGYMLRHKVKPGITGLAQVRGQRGGDDVDSMRARINSDLEYLRSWTLGLDIAILLRTLPVLMGDKQAY
jgi:putative colanic acid biosynthesis UDP-glucose lipid carrier transferase